ncbi:MAG: hybrid sensor histidine kinase/response regulator [Cellvibrionaceae bacterium]|nr:hybrid sensor histidine kinase/response regulator [Cellvibrionaceae bacterium]
MFETSSLALAILCYLILLFWIASRADRYQLQNNSWTRGPVVYAFALGVYCTSWTFYGLVGTAAENGWRFLPILLGPALLFIFGTPLCRRVAALCKQENIRSVADFLAARYGKRRGMATCVTIIMFIATVPYIALQIKAVTDSLILITPANDFSASKVGFASACAMATFSLLFGARRLESNGYHAGLMSAIAFESLVKLLAFLALAGFSLTIIVADTSTAETNPFSFSQFAHSLLNYRFILETLISAAAILCLPRMFHVAFVEQLSDRHFNQARKIFPAYLGIVAICIVIISLAGRAVFHQQSIPGDNFVLMLPKTADNQWLTVLAFLGGLSAATAMIIVATVTLSYMLSNDVILPLLLRRKRRAILPTPDFSTALINTRRATVLIVIALAYGYQLAFAGNAALSDIGLVAFALAVQLSPSLLFGIYTKQGNAYAAYGALAVGCSLWFITLMLPLMADAGAFPKHLVEQGFFGLAWLRPEYLFNLDYADAFSRGVTVSLLANIVSYWLFAKFGAGNLADRIQAKAFTSLSRATPTQRSKRYSIADLRVLLINFLGYSATEQLIQQYSEPSQSLASSELVDAAEHALSGVVGITTAIAMLNNLESKIQLDVEDVVNIVEGTTKVLRFNQDMIIASFESISSGVSVVDENLKIVSWNRRYEEIFAYEPDFLKVGMAVEDLVRFNSKRGLMGKGSPQEHVQRRITHLRSGRPYRVIRNHRENVIEIKGNPLPNGGYVTTYDDISEFIGAQDRLEKTKLYLEQRVKERTTELELAQQAAVNANRTKSQFLAQASHDILQPLNAASLYASVLLEQAQKNNQQNIKTIEHLNAAIQSSENIISTLLEISKLDTGTIKTQVSKVNLHDALENLANEFRVQLHAGCSLNYIPTSATVNTDPRYLRRILQNFLSNAVKYTRNGRICLGCRRRKQAIEVFVYDTGNGIPDQEKTRVFEDFYRASNQQTAPGIGLGLAVAKRFSELLNLKICCQSELGKGSSFSVIVPQVSRVDTANIPKVPTEIIINTTLQNKTVMYIDDDEQNVLAMEALLNEWGCKLTAATSAEQALLQAKTSGAPDALIVDWDLNDDKGYDGVRLTHALRGIWQRALPACLVSAVPKAKLAIGEIDQMEFLQKPLKPGKLRAVLEQLIKRSENLSNDEKSHSTQV